MSKKIVFVTGTRADFGKLKSLITAVEQVDGFEVHLFVTGMHLMEEYGYTLIEIERCQFSNIKTFYNHSDESSMDVTLANTIQGFSDFVRGLQPDLIVTHGDRVETLAASIVGSLNNILVAHIEGGELSGTIDELIRHATSKMSHIHFVSHTQAKKRLEQMGELPRNVHVIGSPDIDLMTSDLLPTISSVSAYYDIPFENYAVAMFHPITTEIDQIEEQVTHFISALTQSNQNYVLIYPNNDRGSKSIIQAIKPLAADPKFKVFPSIRFEYFLTLLKNASFIIGNSSAGIREAPYYGVPTINIGSRQNRRSDASTIIDVTCNANDIISAINALPRAGSSVTDEFGQGNATTLFMECLKSKDLWKTAAQKQFRDLA